MPPKVLDLLADYPGVWVYTDPHSDSADCDAVTDPDACRVVAVYGERMTEGATPQMAAANWLAEWAAGSDNVFGVDDLDLRLIRHNAVGSGRFTVFAYQQYINELPVVSPGIGLARVVVAHTKPPAVVYASGYLKAPPIAGLRPVVVTAASAVAVVQAMPPFAHLDNFHSAEMVVYAPADDDAGTAWHFFGSGTDPATGGTEAYEFFVDASNGAYLAAFNTIHRDAVAGKVRGYVTPGRRPYNASDPLELVELEGLEMVGEGSETARTDPHGNFLLHTGETQIALDAVFRTPWLEVYDFQVADSFAGQTVDVSAGVDIVLNPTGGEFTTTQVNTLYHGNKVYRFFKDREPQWAGLDYPIRIYVNTPSSAQCDAFFAADVSPVIFFEAAGQCPNGSYSTTLAHEYGHSVVHALGPNLSIGTNGAANSFHEGFADAVSLLLYDDPIVSQDGYVIGKSLRDYRCHEVPYPCPYGSGETEPFCNEEDDDPRYPHGRGYSCGMTLPGAWWKIKGQLEAALGKPMGLARARQLFTDWAQITIGPNRSFVSATPLTAIEVVLADDLAHGDAELNTNGAPDACAICRAFAVFDIPCPPAVLQSGDFNTNGVPDACEDCNTNGTADDRDDISAGTSLDCNSNAVPDECEPDCNGTGHPDDCDIAAGTSPDGDGDGGPDQCADCNTNGVADGADISAGTSADCNGNAVPDECEPSCNGSSVPDACRIATGASADCTSNGLPDECEPDCNANAAADSCDIFSGVSADCNGNLVPDECELLAGSSSDCDENGVPDECDLRLAGAADCNFNGVPDKCELADNDCNGNAVPDACDLLLNLEVDCNGNDVPDVCDLAGGTSTDVDTDGVPDGCPPGPRVLEIASVAFHNSNGPWAGGDIELCVEPDGGTIEPRPFRTGAFGPLYLRLRFDAEIDPASLDAVRIVPAGRVEPVVRRGTLSPTGVPIDDPQTVSITFRDPSGTLNDDVTGRAPAPSGTYRFDIRGLRGVNGGRVGALRGSFVVCYLSGDFNLDGAVNILDWIAVTDLLQVPLDAVSQPLDALADFNRNGLIQGVDRGQIRETLYQNPPQPVACSPACSAIATCLVGDCNTNAIWDACELAAGSDQDCNENARLDVCDIAAQLSTDLNSNGLLDACEDCNLNSFPDDLDIVAGTSTDFNLNDAPDDCERDCNSNGIPDLIECFENDYDRDGDADLADFAAFQRCAGLGSLNFDCSAFAHCDANGALDFPDFRDAHSNGFTSTSGYAIQPGPNEPCYGDELFAMMMGGGGEGMLGMMLGGEGIGSMQSSAQPSVASSPIVVEMNLWLEVQPVGGGEALTVLEPYTTYELHYTAEASSIGFYVLYVCSNGVPATAPLLIDANSNAWSSADIMELGSDSSIDSPMLGAGWVRVSGMAAGYWGGSGAAARAGRLIHFQTRGEGAIAFELSMGYVDYLSDSLFSLEHQAAFVVEIAE